MTEWKPPTLNPVVVEVVSRHNPNARNSLPELEQRVAEYCSVYRKGVRFALPETAIAMGATPVERIQNQVSSIQTSYTRRLADLYCSVIEHINALRLLDLGLVTRACMEFSGAIVFYEQRLMKQLQRGVESEIEQRNFQETLTKAVLGGRFDWAKWFQGGADLKSLLTEYAEGDRTPTSPIQAKNVLDFISVLDAAVAEDEPPAGAMKAMYGLLSDICHPAVGGRLLYLSVPQPDGWRAFDQSPNEHMACWFVGAIATPAVIRTMRYARISLNRLTHINQNLVAEPTDARH